MNYPDIIFSTCLVGHESVGNALAVAAGFKGMGQAFGGEFGIGLRPIGSGSSTPVAWAHQSVARQGASALVFEFNGSAPYPLLNAIGFSAEQILPAKSVVVAEVFPRLTHEREFAAWLASKGYEVIR